MSSEFQHDLSGSNDRLAEMLVELRAVNEKIGKIEAAIDAAERRSSLALRKARR